jgi:UDP-N-acetylmuramoyl-tripeptide--D-alanyl-D-alanine ligase
MNPITIQTLKQAVAGKLLSAIPSQEPSVKAVSIDSRNIEPGCVFVAIRGERTDGHLYLQQAAAAGAVAAIVDSPPTVELPNITFIQVPDTRVALGKLATHVRRQMFTCKVVGVAGSNGKTSTKHLIGSALSGKLSGSISPKSFNNDIGVPMTIFPADPGQDFLVLEIGTNHPGEIKALATMSQPDIAVITNCSAEHLEGLGDLRGVRTENACMIDGLRAGGLLVVNGDDEQLLEATDRWDGRRVTFGFSPSNDVFATDVELHDAATDPQGLEGTSFRLNNRNTRVFVPMLGKHFACNALAAIAVARRLGVNEDDMIQGLARSSKPDMRMNKSTLASGVVLLNDAYNANPGSMQAAIDTLIELPARGRRVVVLGDMRELGVQTENYHRRLGEEVARRMSEGLIDQLVCVGPCGQWMAEAAIAAGSASKRVDHFSDSIAAAPYVSELLRAGDIALVKGSRGMRMERVCEAMQQVGQMRQSHAAHG